MAITRYEPWGILNDFQKEINNMFKHRYGVVRRDDDDTQVVTSDWVPAVDVKEDDDKFTILVDVPGVDTGDIEVTMEKGVLSIRGERHTESEQEHDGYKRIERARGTFYRSFALPDTADAENITARGKNGVLEIVIPKHARVQPRKIAVES